MADLQQLLPRTGRALGLAIPLLPDPPRQVVTLSYLVIRIADTLEDATHWSRGERVAALADLAQLLREPLRHRALELAERWTTRRASEHPSYLELMGELP